MNLLPCPFCGSKKVHVIYNDGYEVGCVDCATYIAPYLGADADNKQKHIDFWNTRADCWRPIEECQNSGMYLTFARFPNGHPCYDLSTFHDGVWRDGAGDVIFPTHYQPLTTPKQ